MYTEQDYRKIFYLVKNDMLVCYSKYQELVPYNDILKVMFKPWDAPRGEDDYAYECISLLKKIPDTLHNIDEKVIKFCTFKKELGMFTSLSCIFTPKEVIEEGRYIGYYIYHFIYEMHDYIVNNNPIDFTYSKLSNYCAYYDSIINNDEFFKHREICNTLLAYIYANDADYQILDQFLSDPEYFTEVFKTRGINIQRLKEGCFYNMEYTKLYANGNFLFSKNLKTIK